MADYRLPSWTPTYADIRDGAIRVADERGLPRRRVLGLCFAESGFGLQSFDRWASSERTRRMVAAIDARDWSRVEAIFGEIKGTPTNDISFGPCHQSWWWSLSAAEQRAHPEWRHDLERIMAFRAQLIEDHGYALRLAAGKIAGEGSDLDILCLYNKPAVDPAVNPNRPNYQRSLVEADRILAEMAPVPAPLPGAVRYEDYRDPSPAGRFPVAPKGVILHGSRSGIVGNPLEREYAVTARYEQTNTADLGWHATIGENVVAVHLTPYEWGWNARAASGQYIAVEIAQPTVDDAITDAQVAALADYLLTHIFPVWGDLGLHFPTHAELELWGETGARDGKTDIYPAGDSRVDGVRNRLYALLQAPPAPPPEPVPPPPPKPSDREILTEVRKQLTATLAYLDAQIGV